jgi:colanic acid/amylovoran biosynthesis protein
MGAENLRFSLHTHDPVYDREHFAGVLQATYSPSNMPPAHLTPNAQRFCYRAAKWAGKTPMSRFVPRSVADGLNADLIIATGGDTFTSDYRSFAKHARILHFGTPVAMLAQTIGPFTSADEKRFVASTRHIALCTVRESETLEYINDIAPGLKPQLTADVAFLLPGTAPDIARKIVEVDNRFPIGERRLVGLAVSAGLLSYRTDVNQDRYLDEIAAFIDDLNRSGWSVLLIPHVQESWRTNNDIYACRDVLRRVRSVLENTVLYSPMSSSDFKGVIGLCDVLVGVRMHTNIAAMSQGVPTVAIAYSRKARATMRDYYGAAMAEKITVDVADLDRQRLRSAFDQALGNGKTESRAAEMRQHALQNFVRVRELLQNSR